MNYTFSEFIRTARQSPMLQPGEITDYIAANDLEPVHAYLYRIAALVAADIKNTNEFRDVDDSDFIDATQECFPHMAYVINLSPNKFSGYAAVAFRRVIRRYLRGVLNGGTGSDRSGASPPVELRSTFWGESSDWNEDTFSDMGWGSGMYDEMPIGLGDPAEELLRIERVETMLEAANAPIVKSKQCARDNAARERRIAKEIGTTQSSGGTVDG